MIFVLEILGLIADVEADYKIVMVDPQTLKIVDAACSMHEILDSGVYCTYYGLCILVSKTVH